jgi:3-oxoadipate enol-lactonase
MMSGTTELAGCALSVAGGRLWVEHAGDGPTVVFAHAGIADRRMWDDQVAALVDRYHVVRYDQRGYGKSSSPTQPFSHVADLEAVLNHVGADLAVLVGSSVGGATIIDYTLDHPERVAALVPVAAGISGFAWQPAPAYRAFEAAVNAADPERMTSTGLATWAPLRTLPEIDERIRQLLVDSLPGLTTLGKYWLDHIPAYGRLSDIAAPTLVVVGECDQPDFLRIAHLLATDIADAKLVVLAGVDHNVPVRAGQRFTEQLTGFLDGLPLAPRGTS